MKKAIFITGILLTLGGCASNPDIPDWMVSTPIPSLDKFAVGSTKIEDARKILCRNPRMKQDEKNGTTSLACSEMKESFEKHGIKLMKENTLTLSFNKWGYLTSIWLNQEIEKEPYISTNLTLRSFGTELVKSEIDGVFFSKSGGCPKNYSEDEFGCMFVSMKSKIWVYPEDAWFPDDDGEYYLYRLRTDKNIRLYKYKTDEIVVLKTASRAKRH